MLNSTPLALSLFPRIFVRWQDDDDDIVVVVDDDDVVVVGDVVVDDDARRRAIFFILIDLLRLKSLEGVQKSLPS